MKGNVEERDAPKRMILWGYISLIG